MKNNLIINRIKFRILDYNTNIQFHSNGHFLFKREAKFLINELQKAGYIDESLELKKILPDDYEKTNHKISFSFATENVADSYLLNIDLKKINCFKKSFVKYQLINFFKSNSFLVEPIITGSDIAIYEKTSSLNNEWDIYRRYEISIFPWENEISISVTSSDTVISKDSQNIAEEDNNLNIVNDDDSFIRKLKYIEHRNPSRLVANKNKRKELGIKNKIKRKFYIQNYEWINNIYNLLVTGLNSKIQFEGGGFKNIHPNDIGEVDYENNLMLFGREHTDINAATGMRDGGPFEVPKEKSEKIKLLFIYQNKDQANNLYLSLKRGLEHYPGLLSYVGIPVNITNEKLQYKDLDSLIEDLNDFINKELPNVYYYDYLALVIIPFSKESSSIREKRIYFELKEALLKKGITSQFISSQKINSNTFHFHLSNISVALLAKIGGIPWRLKRKSYEELIVGFNEEKSVDNSFVGSAIYFDNSGKLKQVKALPSSNNNKELIIHLRDSIKNYLLVNDNNPPDRLVIHYYKPPRQKDIVFIDELIREEFRFNLPFALVEINDSKDKIDICFDIEFNYGMPTSGTYIRLNKKGNEYLLFNNLRYWKNPLKTIDMEEYPIKIKLFNAESGGFTHKELISQVYEFSRLYWKGLKQRSQPVTTQYSKLIAECALNFSNKTIPENEVTQHTVWFI